MVLHRIVRLESKFVRALGALFLIMALAHRADAQDHATHEAPNGFFRDGAPELPETAQAVVLPAFTDLARVLSPVVVNISVEAGSERSGSKEEEALPKEGDPGSPFRSSGSGFIVHPDGYIVTSNHVVDKSDRIIIRLLDDKTEYPAEVVGKDKKTDIALLKIKAVKPLPVAYIGDSDAVEVGEWAIAIGNQFELGQTVTAGIVSAKARRLPSRESGPYDQYIQTDASINPGSSGGPLFNTKGQVIAVNTAIFTPGRGGVGFNIGIGFAIPINLVKEVIAQLRDKGKVTRGMLGVIIQKIDSTMAEALGITDTSGALVAEVVKDSPAARAGLLQRDIVVSFDGRRIEEYEDLPLMVARTPVGKEVQIQVNRQGSIRSFTAKIEELKEAAPQEIKKNQKSDLLGLKTEVVPEEVRKLLKLGAEDGILVVAVDPNSAGERAGIVAGDVLLEIHGKRVKGPESYAALIAALPKNKAVLVMVQKRDGTRFLSLKIR